MNERDLRILHITAFPNNSIGGVQVVPVILSMYQDEIEGMHSSVVCVKRYENEKIMNEKVKQISIKEFESYVKSYCPTAAVIHGLYYREYVAVCEVLKRINIPYYIEPHGAFEKEAMRYHMIRKCVANIMCFDKIVKGAYGYVFLNEEERKRSVYHSNKDVLIPNGIEIYGIEEQVRRSIDLLYIGRYDIHHKGLDYLLNALKILDNKKCDYSIDFFGTGKKKNEAYLDEKITRLRNVKGYNRGPIDNNIKNTKISQHKIMILTSRYEGFPLTVLEALSCGVPCIVTPGTNVSEMIMENKLGWVVEPSPKSIAEMIVTALKEYKEHAVEYCERCYNFVKSNYTWEIVAEISKDEMTKSLFLPGNSK